MDRDIAIEIMSQLELIKNELRISNNFKAIEMSWTPVFSKISATDLLQLAEFKIEREVR